MELCVPFSAECLIVAAALHDCHKLDQEIALGVDLINSEFLINCFSFSRAWLAQFHTDNLKTGDDPFQVKRAKIDHKTANTSQFLV